MNPKLRPVIARRPVMDLAKDPAQSGTLASSTTIKSLCVTSRPIGRESRTPRSSDRAFSIVEC
jgi:hypothetical protein